MSNANGKTVWVTGSEGFVGSVMMRGLEIGGYRAIGTDAELSVCEPERLEAFAEEVRPDFIVNCAGLRRDAATIGNKVHAYEVNALGARNVALVANTVGATMVQISTDDVYGHAQAGEPVNEFDQPYPDTPYGKSKHAGETMIRNTTPDHLILRSSWLYEADRGRMKALLDAAADGGTYESRTDQFAAPTSVLMYMRYLLKMMERGAKGTYHITPRGRASRYEFASQVLEYAGYDPQAVLVPKADPATVEDVVLESLMLEMAGAELPTWQECLKEYMQRKSLLA